jgi:hypothetical protein
MTLNQEQYEAAKAVLEAELSDTVDEREKERLTTALETLAKLVVTDASE